MSSGILSVVGIEGKFNKNLACVPDMYSAPNMELSHAYEYPDHEFMAGFFSEPPVDFTIIRYYSGETSVVSTSLDQEKSTQYIEDIATKLSLQSYPATPAFLYSMQQVFFVEHKSYEMAMGISNRLHVNPNQSFGLMHYMNFLTSYKGLSFEDAKKGAAKKFHVNADSFHYSN